MTVYDTYIVNTRDDVIAACNQIIALYGHSGVGINTDVKKLAACFEVVKGWGIVTGTWTVNALEPFSNLNVGYYGRGKLFVGISEPFNGIVYPSTSMDAARLGYRAVIFDDGRVLVPGLQIYQTTGENSLAAPYAVPYAGCSNATEYWIPLDTPQYLNDQSHDMDVMFKKTKSKTYSTDVIISARRTKSSTFDLMAKKTFQIPIDMDIMYKVTNEKYINEDILIKKMCNKSATFDITSILRKTKTLDIDVHFKKQCQKTFLVDYLLMSTPEETYGMEVTFRKSIVDDILTNTETYIPQFPAIGLNWKKRPYDIFDSRKQTKV